jgi:hypothetical protein
LVDELTRQGCEVLFVQQSLGQAPQNRCSSRCKASLRSMSAP